MTQDRIASTFQRRASQGRPCLILFLTVGYPDLKATRELVPALVESGADIIELGVPFSDPLADGPTIQASSYHALQQGVTLQDCLSLVAELRSRVPDTPLVLMSYYNPILSYGLATFAQAAQGAGVDGLIVSDLPAEEVGPLAKECSPKGIHIIPLLAPTSTDDRIKKACQKASGFIYCVSLTGVTGARDQLPPGVFQLLKRVRQHTRLPLVVGFGISRKEHVDAVVGHAQGVVVGSALVKVLQDAPRAEVVERARRFVVGLRGTAQPLVGGSRA